MENSLKQRIVGAVVLIGLAVIFLPAILKEKTESQPFQSEIPPKPIELVEHRISEEDTQKNREVIGKLDQIAAENRKKRVTDATIGSADEPEPTQNNRSTNQGIDQASSLSNEPVEAQNKSAQVQTDVAQVPAETIGKNFKDAAWVVKVASFSNLDNAKKLVKKLKDAGHKAYRRDGKTAQGRAIYRIYVGPYIEKSAAAAQLATISSLSQSKAMLIAYDPIKH
ncbi:hypothetical protein FLL45_05910 [Aliikangiella marina]|uniref:SPOR domain-containing protein n=1 Tax=Aliikangiella marina TaxID=1712262 RepID=A0A545TJS7_9GAMM|nr:SPOR domain-containing protein [Aliikangiella marina]TQV77475.1 hypothetical protein FLL45_05910 [Aliikangiella marina]